MKIKVKYLYMFILTIILLLSFSSYEIHLYYSVYSLLQIVISVLLLMLTIIIIKYEPDIKSEIIKNQRKNRIVYILFSLMIIHTSVDCIIFQYNNPIDIIKVGMMFISALNLFIVLPILFNRYSIIIDYLLKLIVFLCFILSIISIIISFNGEFLGYTYRYTRNASIYSDPNFLGMILGIGILLTIKTKCNNIIKYILFIVLGYSIFLTGSRGTFVALMISAAMGVLFFSKANIWKKMAYILMYSIIGIYLLNYLSNIKFFREAQGSNGRIDMIVCAMKGIEHSPIIGYGYSSIETYLHNNEYSNASTHNSFIDFLFSYGIVPFAIYIYFLFKNTIPCLRTKRDSIFAVIIFFSIVNMNTILYNFGGVGISSLLFTLILGILNNNNLKEE